MPRAEKNRQPEIPVCLFFSLSGFHEPSVRLLVHLNRASDSPVHPANMNRASDLPVHFCVHIRFMQRKHLLIKLLPP